MLRRRRLIGGSTIAVLGGVSLALLALRGGAGHTGAAAGNARLRLAPLSSLGALRRPGAPGRPGPEGVPIPVAPAVSAARRATAQPVDGIECSANEQTLFHIHAHLTIFVDGAARRVPYGIGIADARVQSTPQGAFVGSGRCFYWLHTHAADGIIHIESPVERDFTLGQFFDVWGEPLDRTRVGPWAGRVTAIYNGRRVEGDPREIPLAAHAQLQLEVGRPLLAPQEVAFPEGL